MITLQYNSLSNVTFTISTKLPSSIFTIVNTSQFFTSKIALFIIHSPAEAGLQKQFFPIFTVFK